MKIFLSIFALSTAVFFFFSLSVAYSWIFYLSATIHKNHMFLFCNGILVFIHLNSWSSVSLEKDHGQELAGKKQAAVYCESLSLNRGRTVGVLGNEKEMGLLHVAGDDDEKAGKTLSDVVEETYGDDYDDEVAGDDQTLLVNFEERRDHELEAVEDDKTLSVVEETRDVKLEVVEDDKTLSLIGQTKDDVLELVEDNDALPVTKETQDDELEAMEDDKTPSVVEETQNDGLEAMEDDKTGSVVEETRDDDEQEQGGSIDTISLEELNRKCEEFIRRMKKDIRIETLIH